MTEPDEIAKQLEALRTEKTRFMACFEAFGYDGDFREACRLQDDIDRLEDLKSSNEKQQNH